MHFEIVSKSYCVELDLEEFVSVLELDTKNSIANRPQLYDLLMNAGAKEIEYDGDYLPAIFFELPADLEDQLANIILKINAYIKG